MHRNILVLLTPKLGEVSCDGLCVGQLRPFDATSRSWPAHRLSRETTANEENRGYYIEWPALEIDLSADTLWHEGKLSY